MNAHSELKIEISYGASANEASRGTLILQVDDDSVRLQTASFMAGSGRIPFNELSKLDFSVCMSILTSMAELTRSTHGANYAENNGLDKTLVSDSVTGAERDSPEPITSFNRDPRTDCISSAGTKRGSDVPLDLGRTYWKLGGSALKVAKHYDVPRQVARDWISELRNSNKIPDQRLARGKAAELHRRSSE